ncbi:MAG TPA: GNAT family N-acetyltransferase [Salinivirgaceae bacterium]|nr:GNAT family N-acetyltransferase [Salinivirgaceae bacterium]
MNFCNENDNNKFQVKINEVNIDELILIHEICDNDFIPRLSDVVNINEYCRKLINKAEIISLHIEGINYPVGIVAIYCNDFTNLNAYITSVCIRGEFRGLGLGKILLRKAFELSKLKGMKKISLEVGLKNEKAINLYRSHGFEIIEQKALTYIMSVNV